MCVDTNCQQICKISRKKKTTEVKVFQNVLESYFFETPCILFIALYVLSAAA